MARKKEPVSANALDPAASLIPTIADRTSPTESKMSLMTVSTRPQTPEEQRQTESALHLLLSELVRQHLQSQGKQP